MSKTKQTQAVAAIPDAQPETRPERAKRLQAPKRPNAKYLAPIIVGLATEYQLTDQGYALVADMARGGHSQASIAAKLGCHSATLTEIKKRDPKLQEALARGYGALEDEVVSTLVQHMRDGNVSATIFLAKGKLGFREVGPADPSQHQHAVNINIQVPPALSPEQVEALLGRPVPKVIEHE